MDKQKEIEKMAKAIYMTGVAIDGTDIAFGLMEDSHFERMARKLIVAGYGDVHAAVKETAQDIFSWIYRNLVNLNFLTGNVEISLLALDTFAKTYGVELLGIFDKLEGKE